jgi:hypothetical protein
MHPPPAASTQHHGAIALPARPLANGCVVESVAFAENFRADFPAEDARLLVFEAGPENVGHAVCVFTAFGRVWAHDFELGDYEVGGTTVLDDLRQHVMARNRELVAQRLGSAGRRTWHTVDERTEIDRALRRLPAATRPCPVFVWTGIRQRGVAFFYAQRAWVYLPRFGTTQVPVSSDADWAQAMTASVRSHWPGARLEMLK